MKKILILKAGSTFPELKDQKGDFEDWIIVCSKLPNRQFHVVHLEKSDIHSLDLHNFKAALITGSHAMVTDQPPWLKNAFQLLKRIHDLSIPVLGICFGHQLIAETFGGKVGVNPHGNEFGAVEIQLSPNANTDRLFSRLPNRFKAFMSHSQTVIQLPPGAVHLAKSSRDKHAAFFLPPNIWGVQFHPEFDRQIMRFYLIHHFNIPDNQLEQYLQNYESASSIIHLFLNTIVTQ